VYPRWYDLLVTVSLLFGVYMAAAGVAVVFATLLAVAAVSGALLRTAVGGVEEPGSRNRLARVAAVAAVYCLGGPGEGRHQRVRVQARSQWSSAARAEALGMYGGGFDEKKVQGDG